MTTMWVLLAVLLALAVLAWVAAVIDEEEYGQPSRFSRAVAAGVEQALQDAQRPGGLFDQAINDVLVQEAKKNAPVVGPLNLVQFVWQMAFEFIRAGDLKADDASKMAIDTLKEFLRAEKIRFGDPGYAWDQSAAVILARECAIDYWEAVA
jgi:hypothetical protein